MLTDTTILHKYLFALFFQQKFLITRFEIIQCVCVFQNAMQLETSWRDYTGSENEINVLIRPKQE